MQDLENLIGMINQARKLNPTDNGFITFNAEDKLIKVYKQRDNLPVLFMPPSSKKDTMLMLKWYFVGLIEYKLEIESRAM